MNLGDCEAIVFNRFFYSLKVIHVCAWLSSFYSFRALRLLFLLAIKSFTHLLLVSSKHFSSMYGVAFAFYALCALYTVDSNLYVSFLHVSKLMVFFQV